VLGGVTKTQHLVKLSSVEDDGLGEELQVIWELEVGAHIYEKMELPQSKGFDSPERLDACINERTAKETGYSCEPLATFSPVNYFHRFFETRSPFTSPGRNITR
jgi:hypothetical protein